MEKVQVDILGLSTSPASGGAYALILKEVNGNLEDNPGVVNGSPYEDGWFIKIEMSDESEVESLMTHGAYQEMIGA